MSMTPGPWRRAVESDLVVADTEDGVEIIAEGVAWYNRDAIAAVPSMYAYIEQRASEGDERAQKILSSLW